MATVTWTDLVLAYAGYLTATAWAMPRFARARVPSLAVAAGSMTLWALWSEVPGAPTAGPLVARIVVPSLVLIVMYRVSGLFFVGPDQAAEQRLLALDAAWLRRTRVLGVYRAAPALVREFFELTYLLVYAMVPLGGTVLVLGGRADALESFWAVVFAAELACYAVLPWVQTRPPRAIEHEADGGLPTLRRLNLAVLEVGSIQVNTFPSAHAAGAVAVALAVSSAVPAAGPALLALATSITLATVLGRYHFLADSVLGVAVGLAAWLLLGA